MPNFICRYELSHEFPDSKAWDAYIGKNHVGIIHWFGAEHPDVIGEELSEGYAWSAEGTEGGEGLTSIDQAKGQLEEYILS